MLRKTEHGGRGSRNICFLPWLWDGAMWQDVQVSYSLVKASNTHPFLPPENYCKSYYTCLYVDDVIRSSIALFGWIIGLTESRSVFVPSGLYAPQLCVLQTPAFDVLSQNTLLIISWYYTLTLFTLLTALKLSEIWNKIHTGLPCTHKNLWWN